ncbi:hypothetical protein IV102_23545 [bacterium]|nr:hypothetical protein [bacterium]
MAERASYDRVRREDMLLFVNAGLTATGQGGFYHGAIEERLSLAFLHLYIAQNYRRLYTLLLAGGLNDHNTAHAAFTLLSGGAPPDPAQRSLENELLTRAIARLPPQRAYRLFERLAQSGVNNRRTRATIASYLKNRHNLAFDAVKYRHRLKKAILHSHAGVAPEVKRFLYEGAGSKPYRDPMLETYRKAHYDQRYIYELPFTVAQGLAQRKKIPRQEFMEKIEPRMTEREKLRWQQAGAAAFDPSRADLVELCIYFLRLPDHERVAPLPTLRQRAAQLAPTLQLPASLSQGRVAVVLDRSRSSYGSAQARCRPLAVAMAAHLALQAGCASYSAHWSHPTPDLIDLHPTGHTALGEPLLEALAKKPEVVIVVSDARENAPSGACQAIAAAFAARLPDSPLWIHFNPTFDPEDFQPMTLGPSWPVVGIRRAEDLATGFVLASFATGRCPVTELEAYLEERAVAFLERPDTLALH